MRIQRNSFCLFQIRLRASQQCLDHAYDLCPAAACMHARLEALIFATRRCRLAIDRTRSQLQVCSSSNDRDRLKLHRSLAFPDHERPARNCKLRIICIDIPPRIPPRIPRARFRQDALGAGFATMQLEAGVAIGSLFVSAAKPRTRAADPEAIAIDIGLELHRPWKLRIQLHAIAASRLVRVQGVW